MPNIVILGSLGLGEYKVTYPKVMSEEYYTDHEKGYEIAKTFFYPAIREAHFVICLVPEGFKKDSHTLKDALFAMGEGKTVYFIGPDLEDAKCANCFWGRKYSGQEFGCYFGFTRRAAIPLPIASTLAACEVEGARTRMFGKLGAHWSPKIGGDPWREAQEDAIWT